MSRVEVKIVNLNVSKSPKVVFVDTVLLTNCLSRQLTVGDFDLVRFSDYGGFIGV